MPWQLNVYICWWCIRTLVSLWKHGQYDSKLFIWWIPRTNGQWRRKYFHLMTSSWIFWERAWLFWIKIFYFRFMLLLSYWQKGVYMPGHYLDEQRSWYPMSYSVTGRNILWLDVISYFAGVVMLSSYQNIISLELLADWRRNKMADISQTTFLNAFSWMKLYEVRLIFHRGLYKLTIFRHWLR